jgi:hypothetical protein
MPSGLLPGAEACGNNEQLGLDTGKGEQFLHLCFNVFNIWPAHHRADNADEMIPDLCRGVAPDITRAALEKMTAAGVVLL